MDTVFLKAVVIIETGATPLQVRQALVSSGLRRRLQDKITALAAGDSQTTLNAFRWKLNVHEVSPGVIHVYPKLVIDYTSTRTEDQIYAALEGVIDEFKQRLRDMVAGFPGTTITGWHVHRSNGAFDEVEL